MNENPLLEIAQFVKDHRGAAVIFDLDSTLFCVSPRSQAILRDLGRSAEFADTHRDLAEVLKNIEVLPTEWGIRRALERHQAPGTLEQFLEVRDHWRKQFFANHYLVHDLIYPAANEYVRHLHDLGAEILYLTGRNEGSMKEGTIAMLKHWGFPYFADSRLFMKSSEIQTDEGFKATVLQELIKRYPHICFFENEPVIIAQVRAVLPQVKIIFVNSVHSGQAPAPADLPQIGMSYVAGLPKKS